ncbi:hypothetical protein CCACVL1_06780 [Corchorus capsularis]|uniref:Uncharacterized protein n=1 Tax=Corchorus capsularis TaxID=210143 RepID=A0A1R3JCY7_COCAP|nr:hypothetical protein CCACVL1_06780 [Corchorus capsularis]
MAMGWGGGGGKAGTAGRSV